MSDIGEYDCLVAIRKPAGAVNAWNEPVPEAWLPVATTWASIRHLSGVESIRADAVTSTVRASIRISYRKGIVASMQVLHDGMVYKINAVVPDKINKEHVDLVCEVIS
ncbi:MAG: head-tail adaptor protein [Rhodoferax sp.]|nr:head-tail adaptor protein [Rhodoferax sp.]